MASSDSLTVPTWLTAVFTGVLGFGAIVTSVLAYRALHKQSEEVRLLREQANRDIAERRRDQASHVYIVIAEGAPAHDGGILLTATATNASKRPVYDIDVQWRMTSGTFGRGQVKPQLVPGEECPFQDTLTGLNEAKSPADLAGLSVTMQFSDAQGIRWSTTDRGALMDLTPANTRPKGSRFRNIAGKVMGSLPNRPGR